MVRAEVRVGLELAEYKGKRLIDIMQPLRMAQRDYLMLVLIGTNKEEALEIVERAKPTLDYWEKANDRSFKDIERFVLSNREEYIDEAAREYARIIRAKSILALARLADKALDWGSVENADKAYVFGALKELKNLGIGKELERGSGGSYEELILRKRVETK